MILYLIDHSVKVDKTTTLSAYEVEVSEFFGNKKKLDMGMLFDINSLTFEICDYKYSKVHNEWYYVYRYYVPFKIKVKREAGKDVIGNDNLK